MIMQNYSQGIITNKVFEFIFECAMRDATLQKAFKGEKNWIGKVTEAQLPLRKYIDKLFKNEFKSQQDHDFDFLKVANTICKSINDKKPVDAEDTFSFGNAQKLINMTVKYCYSVCYFEPKKRALFQYCHCPLDSIMLNTVWKEYQEKFNQKIDLKINFCKPWGDEGLSYGIQPKLDSYPNRYQQFQCAVKKLIGDSDIFPIEYDYLVWNK